MIDQKIQTFDPERAGFTYDKGKQWRWKGRRITIEVTETFCRRLSISKFDEDVLIDSFYLPADLPHDVALSILRANGYEGGEG